MHKKERFSSKKCKNKCLKVSFIKHFYYLCNRQLHYLLFIKIKYYEESIVICNRRNALYSDGKCRRCMDQHKHKCNKVSQSKGLPRTAEHDSNHQEGDRIRGKERWSHKVCTLLDRCCEVVNDQDKHL